MFGRRKRETYCPSCGLAGVVVGLDSVLIETIPTVRRHACGVGGPGATFGPWAEHNHSNTGAACAACR